MRVESCAAARAGPARSSARPRLRTGGGQTRIAFAFDDGALRRTGELTWPSAQDPIDTYVDRLVRVMEAGLVRGCAPAKLPPIATLRGDAGRVSSVDADPSQRAGAHRELERRLDGLGPQACRGAK